MFSFMFSKKSIFLLFSFTLVYILSKFLNVMANIYPMIIAVTVIKK